MNCKLVEYHSENGDTKKVTTLEARLCWGEEPASVWIELPDDRSTRNTAIQLSIPRLLYLLRINKHRMEGH